MTIIRAPLRAAVGAFLAAALAGSFAVGAFAARPADPAERGHPAGFFPIVGKSSIAGLRAGAATGLSLYSSWITSDLEGAWDSTDVEWYDTEELTVFGAFSTPFPKEVSATFTVSASDARVVFTSSLKQPPIPGEINGLELGIGKLPEGSYKVAVRFKQGSKAVGATYWLRVLHYVPASPEP